MVQCMEAWFIADRQALAAFFGQCFRQNQLPDSANSMESIAKRQLYTSLANATKGCQKGPYGKGAHSFKLLALINPESIKNRFPLGQTPNRHTRGTGEMSAFQRIEGMEAW